MRRAVHFLLVVFGCVQAACAPAFLSSVLCTAPSGHCAIESLYVATKCAADRTSTSKHDDAEHPTEPCSDVQLGSAQALEQSARSAASFNDFAMLPPVMTVSVSPAEHCASSGWSRPVEVTRPPDSSGLRNVILLI